jgi:beta-mannosidase
MTNTWNTSETIDLQKNSVAELKEAVPVTSEVCFLKLTIRNQKGETLADNLYWLSTTNNFKSFSSLPEPQITITSGKAISTDKTGYHISLSNTGKTIALMTEMKLIDNGSGLEILPSFWSDNYVSLLPGEKKEVFVEVGTNNLPVDIQLKYKAFNMKKAGFLQP